MRDETREDSMTNKVQKVLWLCLVETQQAIALHLNDTKDPRYISELAAQHTLNNQVLLKIKERG